MNIIVVVDDVAVDVFKKWSDVEKYHNLKKEDFVQHGKDYIAGMDLQSYQVSQDIKLLETVASKQIFGKKQVDWLTAGATAIFTVIAVMLFG